MAESSDLHRQAELFLYREAKLLDEGYFNDWLDLLTDDVKFRTPITESRDQSIDTTPLPGDWSIVEEDKRFLAQRCERLAGNFAHSEQPRSRTRRFVSNVLATPCTDGVLVESNFIVFQSRTNDSETFFVGSRKDRITINGDEWKIAERTVSFAHRILPRAISIFI
ncbi:MAG: aromatic-ring-hydroxylating dioxygenase subunit beta [Proteobacteria bacterium]|jgi:dibenzofuran dioxygenase subunit beta|nr:aromatic-ring-hydroxylating dioxygenase subunit beta [Pseudomonadota bacterium]